MREKVGKSRNTVFFQWFVAPEGRKVGSLKWRVRTHLGRWEMKNCTLLWREAHFEVKTYDRNQRRNTFWKLWCGKVHAVVARSACEKQKCKKNSHSQTTFGSCDDEKVHAVVAQSTFRSQNQQNTLASEHFWKLRCAKSARRCGAKHISKWKCSKHMFAPLLDIEASFCVAGAKDSAPC